ncbi:hypothetical protein JCM3765_007046 [Sporobolomyces pararoseus]
MSLPSVSTLSRLVVRQPTLRLPFLPLLSYPPLRPSLWEQLPQTYQPTYQNSLHSTSRSFSTTPFSSAKIGSHSEFAAETRFNSSSQSQAHVFDRASTIWRKAFRSGKNKEDREAEGLREKQKCEADMKALKAHLRRCVRSLSRFRFRSHHNRRRSSTWRPARLDFQTPNFSGFDARKRGNCTQETQRRLKLYRRFPLAFLDERRRRQPQRAAHFRYCVGLVRQEVALHFSVGSRAWENDFSRGHHRWCPKKKFMEKVEAELKSGGAGGKTEYDRAGYGHRRHPFEGRKAENPNFDYSTFRRAYWYSKFHSSSRPYNSHHGEWKRRMNRMPFIRPQEWVLKKPDVVRKRAGIAYFTVEESPSARKVHGVKGRGGNGGIYQVGAKVKSVKLRLPSLGSTSSFLRPSLRPHISIPIPTAPSLFSRSFSSTRPRSGIHFLLPLATALKSTEALHLLVWVTRLSLTLLPLSVRSKAIFALRQRYLRDPSSLTATIFSRLASNYYSSSLAQPSGLLSRWNAFFGLPLLLLSPFLLLGLVGFASLERTPVTGRWRFVMLSPKEEEELVEGVLSVGRTAHSATTSHVHNGEVQALAPEGTSLDWVAILRQVLDLPDEGVDPETGRRMLLDGVVLDQRDWRVRWTEAVLRALEKGVVEGLTTEGAGAKGEGEALRPPPFRYPLEGRVVAAQTGWKDELIMSKHFDGKVSSDLGNKLQVEYDILVIDRDENNAFSFGFAPEAQSLKEKGRRGVIVVYTGFLKEVLGDTAQPNHSVSTSPSSTPHSSRLASFFSRPSAASQTLPQPDPIASYLTPITLPTQEQCKSLAVLLSHEASHLILSHTLESYASMNLLVPHLSRLASDVLRTLLYPVTAILGPFFNDALGKTFNEGAQAGFGFWAHAANSCESRKLESEADLVALRLLAGSGIDPRHALAFWEDRLSTPNSSPSTTLPFANNSNTVHHHSKNASEGSVGLLDGYMRTHPVDQERLEKIRAELKSWEDYNRSLATN